jgi:HSP20 family protein
MSKMHVTDTKTQLLFASGDDPWHGQPNPVSGWRLVKRTHAWSPPTDVLESEEAYVIVVEIAGMRGSEFSVTFDRQLLSIRGTRMDTTARKAYRQMEIAYGEFATEVEVSSPINTSDIEATYSDGFLRIVLPKAQPRQISISD